MGVSPNAETPRDRDSWAEFWAAERTPKMGVSPNAETPRDRDNISEETPGGSETGPPLSNPGET